MPTFAVLAMSIQLLAGASTSGVLRLSLESETPIAASAALWAPFPQSPAENWTFEADSVLRVPGSLHLGDFAPPQYLRLEIEAPAGGRWWLVNELRTPESLGLRLDGRELGTFGTGTPWRINPSGTTKVAVPLDLATGRHRLEARLSDPQGDCRLQALLVPDERMQRRSEIRYGLHAIVLGMILTIFLFAIYLWSVTRVSAMVWYALYIAAGWCWLATRGGLPWMFLWPEAPEWNRAIPSFLSWISVALFVVFLVDALDLRSHAPRVRRVLLAGAAAVATVGILHLLAALAPAWHRSIFANMEFDPLQAVVVLATWAVLAWRVRAGERLARGLFVANLPLLAAMLAGVVHEIDALRIERDWDTPVVASAALLENLLTAFVLASAVRRRDKARLALEEDFHRRLVDRVDVVRRQLSLELHDDLGQRAAALRLEASRTAGESSQLVAGLSDLIDGIRHISADLHPPVLAAAGIGSALDGLARELSERTGVDVLYSGPLDPERFEGIQPVDAVHLFRIAQEAVNNALRHAHPTTVEIRLHGSRRRWCLEVENDGSDMPATPVRNGIGMESMRHRASALGTSLKLERRLGGGTIVGLFFDPSLARSGDDLNDDGLSTRPG